MAFCLLVMTGLALFFLSSQPERTPRVLGPLASRVTGGRSRPESGPVPVPAAAPPVRGIGRFARERTAAPKRL